MYSLTDKIILLISPQQWGLMHVSKHHYAIELAKRENTVYFLNPPDENFEKKIEIKAIIEHPNLYTITYKPFFPFVIRFKFRWLFEQLMKIQINRILKAMPEKPDITWCFESNLFANPKLFKSDITIYHPVDPVIYSYQINVANNSNILFTVSDDILESFDKTNIPKYVINHGVSDEFIRIANTVLHNPVHKISSKTIQIGYIGNLLRPIINRKLLLRIIQENTDVIFNFWGPASIESSNISGDSSEDTQLFIRELNMAKNVILKGVKSSAELSNEIDDMDGFLLFYNYSAGYSDKSNSHKILEYLSTGKVIIANTFTMYSGYTDIIQMCDEDNHIPKIFTETIKNIQFHNSNEKQKKRATIAIENSYVNQLNKIEKYFQTL